MQPYKQKLAELSRIEITKQEQEELLNDMSGILDYVDQITEVATTEMQVKPSLHRNIMREDKNPHKSGLYAEDILNEMPDTEDGYLKVKKIL